MKKPIRDGEAMNEQEARDRRIVVGVDGSESSRAALRWALRQAELTGSAVEAVIAWHFPVTATGYAWVPVPAMDATDWEKLAARQIDEVIAEEVDPAAGVTVTTSVIEGNAAQVLLEAARRADLLVVGSRGHGGFAGTVLGSVSQHCAHQSPCPIVIIRGRHASLATHDQAAEAAVPA
jgi:nucleotide-binding universal stress UspA family protein